MAKTKQTVKEDIFKSTTRRSAKPKKDTLNAGNTRPVGVGLTEGEINALDLIAEEISNKYSLLSRNQLIKLAIRRLIKDYHAGQVDLSGLIVTETKSRVDFSKV